MIDDDDKPLDNDVPPIPPPAAMICRACADLAGHDSPDGITVAYCTHYHCGAIYSPRRGFWKLFTPISYEKFEAEIREALSRFSRKRP